MDVIFYNFDFSRLKECPNPISVNIQKCYCGYGCGEVHFSIDNREIIQLLTDNEYLFFTYGDICGIVTGWCLGEDISIYARTPEWLLTKRGVEKILPICDTAEAVARQAVASVVDFVTLGEVSGVGEVVEYSTDRVRSLYEVVQEVLKAQNLGFEVYPDIGLGVFAFRVYEGGQSLCMFSASNRTAYDIECSVERQDMVTNSGWYERQYKNKGNWNAVNNIPHLENDKPENAYTFYRITSSSYDDNGNKEERFGLWCKKDSYLFCDNDCGTWKVSETKPDTIWIYIDNLSKSGLQKWDAVLKGIKTGEEAILEISQRSKRENSRCEVCRVEYGKDFCLGDIVRVQLEFGDFKRTESKRVSSVNIYYDVDRIGVVPVLESLEE